MIHHKGTNPRTGRMVSQRHPRVLGHQPQNWPLDGMSMPVKDVADVTVEPPQENRERGKGEFSFCRPVALPSLTPPALPSFLVWGRWPQRAPSQELAFQVTPLYSQLYRQRGPT